MFFGSQATFSFGKLDVMKPFMVLRRNFVVDSHRLFNDLATQVYIQLQLLRMYILGYDSEAQMEILAFLLG